MIKGYLFNNVIGKSKRGWFLFALFVVLIVTWSPKMAFAGSNAKRIVSFDLCTEQILLDIVPKEHIAALTFLASDDGYSTVSNKAHGLPITKGAVEDAFKYNADLVLVSSFEEPTKVHLLKKLGFHVETFTPATTIKQLREHVLRLGKLTGYDSEAAKLIEKLNEDINSLALAKVGKDRNRAIFLAANRHTQGENSVVSTLFKLSGYTNIAVEANLHHGGFIGLESLLALEPDLMVVSQGQAEGTSLAAQKLSHPAMTFLNKKMRRVNIPQKYVLCLTPHITKAAAILASQQGGAQ